MTGILLGEGRDGSAQTPTHCASFDATDARSKQLRLHSLISNFARNRSQRWNLWPRLWSLTIGRNFQVRQHTPKQNDPVMTCTTRHMSNGSCIVAEQRADTQKANKSCQIKYLYIIVVLKTFMKSGILQISHWTGLGVERVNWTPETSGTRVRPSLASGGQPCNASECANQLYIYWSLGRL